MEIDNHNFGKNESSKLPSVDAAASSALSMLTK